MFEDKTAPKNRPVRPGFAEDVYGQTRTNPSAEPKGGLASKNPDEQEMCGSALAQRRSANLPKLKELCAGGSSELNISSMECPLASARASQMGELDFIYADSDNHKAELAELYTYSEMDEFALNYECFVRHMRERKHEPIWNDLPRREKCQILQNLLGSFESIDAEQRLQTARIVLYILQGAYGDFAELESKEDANANKEGSENAESNGEGLDVPDSWFGPMHGGTGGYELDCLLNAAANAYLLYEQGFYQPLCSMLRLETSLPFEKYADHSRQSSVSNSRSASHMDLAATSADGTGSACGTFDRRAKRSATLADNERIRVVLSCIYHMVETIRQDDLITRILPILNKNQSTALYTEGRLKSMQKQFLTELEEPLEQSKSPLVIHLFEMMPSFVRAKTPHFPIKKILLLCWKMLLATLGGIKQLREAKMHKRSEQGLPPTDDTIQTAILMKPVLNCGVNTVSFLGAVPIGGNTPAGAGGAEGDCVPGQLGRKVRSIHTVRPFNRQVACSGQSGQESNNQRERSNAFSEDAENLEEPQKMQPEGEDGGMDKQQEINLEDINDAIMPAEAEEDEAFFKLQETELPGEGELDLLDQMLEELSTKETDSDEDQPHQQPGHDTVEDELSGSKLVLSSNTMEQPSPTTMANNPKITVSTGEAKSAAFGEPKQTTTAATSSADFKNEQWKPTEFQQKMAEHAMCSDADYKHKRNMIAIFIGEKRQREAAQKEAAKNGDNGGDQTPKACQSPVKKSSPWPPPPPPGLPWKPKVRESDIENFLQNERQKYFEYQLPNDSTTLFGLPEPVHGSVAALRRNLYTSLNDLQLKAEERYNKYPFSQKEFIEDTPTERLYTRVFPSMTEYVIALLKVILASLPSSKAKIDAVTILSDVLTPETDTNEMLSNSISMDLSHLGHNVLEEHVRVAIDINRHKEILIKAASSILILLLKHFRLNHVYQFENFAQYLVLANCLPLVLKFLDQNICRYFQSKYELAPFNYPQCALYMVRNGNEWPQLTADNVDEGESPTYFLWRNVFSSINLLRVINKLTKGKQARTIMLVVYKSAPVLKRCLRAKLGIFQLYVLKLLKLQARYLGRQWRKTNMDLISAIYMRVRHRLNDDWAFANETTKTKQFDFQREENALGVAIKRFNARRYPHLTKDSDGEDGSAARRRSGEFGHDASALDEWDPKEWEPLDNSLQSALAWEPQFSERFMRNYEQWLDEEVFGRQTDWDALLQNSRGLLDLYC